MSKDKTILPASVIASLYQNSLVIPTTNTMVSASENNAAAPVQDNKIEEKATSGPVKFLGEHLKKILIIVHDSSAVHVNETDFALLTSILNACKLTIADIALVNIAQQNIGLHQILTELPSTLVISFAVDANQLKIKLPTHLYQVTSLGESHLLFSNSLTSMQGTSIDAKQEKAKLWTLLKKIFEL